MLLTSCSRRHPTAGGTDTAPGRRPRKAPRPPLAADPTETPTPTARPREPPPTTLKAAVPAPAGELAANRDSIYCPKGTTAGCRSYADMAGYFDTLIAAVTPMFDEKYGTVSRPAALYYVAAGLTGPTACLKDDGTPDRTPARILVLLGGPGDLRRPGRPLGAVQRRRLRGSGCCLCPRMGTPCPDLHEGARSRKRPRKMRCWRSRPTASPEPGHSMRHRQGT